MLLEGFFQGRQRDGADVVGDRRRRDDENDLEHLLLCEASIQEDLQSSFLDVAAALDETPGQTGERGVFRVVWKQADTDRLYVLG